LTSGIVRVVLNAVFVRGDANIIGHGVHVVLKAWRRAVGADTAVLKSIAITVIDVIITETEGAAGSVFSITPGVFGGKVDSSWVNVRGVVLSNCKGSEKRGDEGNLGEHIEDCETVGDFLLLS